jgi:hypothetical protein
MNTLLTNPPRASEALACRPEFVDAKGLRALFGISRSHGYSLAGAGLVKTVCLRRPGTTRGKRLWQCQSVREYLEANIDHRSK